MDHIGVSILEYLSMAAAVAGICWLLSRRRKAQLAARKPLWVTWGVAPQAWLSDWPDACEVTAVDALGIALSRPANT